jgi:Glycosyltransferase family 87
MIGLLSVASAAATAALLALSVRTQGLVSTLVATYVLYVVDLTVTILVLSPARLVNAAGVGAIQAVFLCGSALVWWWRGRPRPSIRPARDGLAAIVRDPFILLFVLVALAAVGYELFLGLAVPANDYDGLTYHLVKAAAWAQHGGYFWVPNAPYDPINDYGPIAEQQILFYFAAVGKGLLLTVPQLLAEVAMLVAVFGTARRLSFGVRPSAAAGCLLATFALVGLEASTAQNDLVAASLVISAAFLILGPGRAEQVLGGVAIGLALGVKLTSLFVLPVLAALALIRGRRTVAAVALGALGSFLTLSVWVFVLNLVHTGTVLGPGGRAGAAASPGWPESLVRGLEDLYALMDLSAVSNHLISVFAVVGVGGAVCTLAFGIARRRRVGRVVLAALCVALPFLAPLLVIRAGDVIAWASLRLGYPIRGPHGTIGPLVRRANSGDSAFGPVGAVTLLGVSALTFATPLWRRVDPRQLALAASIPVFLVLLALWSQFNVFLPRFFLTPVALTAPLLARLLNGRLVIAAYLIVGAVIIRSTLTTDLAKPLHTAGGHPWHLNQTQALSLVEWEDVPMLTAYGRLVPPHACVAAALGGDEPAYLLFGSRLGRRVFFLPTGTSQTADVVEDAYRDGASYAIISRGISSPTPPGLASLPGEFAAAGWRLHDLGGFWTLATAPRPVTRGCVR